MENIKQSNRRTLRKVKDIIVMTVTVIAMFTVILCLSAIESPEWKVSWIPLQILILQISGGWCYLFFKVNGAFDYLYRNEEEEE